MAKEKDSVFKYESDTRFLDEVVAGSNVVKEDNSVFKYESDTEFPDKVVLSFCEFSSANDLRVTTSSFGVIWQTLIDIKLFDHVIFNMLNRYLMKHNSKPLPQPREAVVRQVKIDRLTHRNV